MNKMDVELTLKDIVDFLYPIGSLYYTQDSNFNPNNHFGGTWVQIKDKFILACGETYKINQTGGEASHVLTIDEMPMHNHRESINVEAKQGETEVPNNDYFFKYNAWDNVLEGSNVKTLRYFGYTVSNGESKAHNNMPPYETAYIWKRTGE